jgi:LuxR family transcriptional regulator, quorum-sensing system regulator BjaR1
LPEHQALNLEQVVKATMLANAAEMISQIQQRDDVDELCEIITKGLSQLGFLGLTFAVVRRIKNLFIHESVMTSWGHSVMQPFVREDLFNHDPVIAASRTITAPLVWDFSIYDPTNPKHVQMMDLRRSCNVSGGICIPVFEPYSGRSVLYLSGNSFGTCEMTLTTLTIIAQSIASRINHLRSTGVNTVKRLSVFTTETHLSHREREVLGWIAFGKSSKDIAVIMSLSEHTINDYVNKAAEKLNASNRTEAVFRALMTNQIDLD